MAPTLPEILAQLPDDTRISITIGTGDLRVGDLRGAFGSVDPNRVLTTGEAAKTFGYSADTWRQWATKIDGATQDEGERGYWRLPYRGCVEHLERDRKPKPFRRRGPWGSRRTI